MGQAAIAIAIDCGCEVFTTVGSKEKKEYLKATFPQLEDDHFCNSRDTSFETDILRITKGKGTLCFLMNKITTVYSFEFAQYFFTLYKSETDSPM